MKKQIVILLLIVISAGIFAQISPGELTKAHSHLEGISKCTQCHVLGEKVTNEKCLDCHTEIKDLIDNNNGYHTSKNVKGKECFVCHSEHHGRNFEIIHFDKKNFDHSLTGYNLEGKHALLECAKCHKQEFIINKISKKKENTFLGLNTKCLSCHNDFHQKSLSSNCSSCHNIDKFRPAVKFDHKTAKFPLKGKHVQVECVKCHKIKEQNGKKFQQFTGIKFSSCTDCHKDIHENRFGQNCLKCHSESSFHHVAGNMIDHNKTGFPLQGKHKVVDCKKCHTQSYAKPLAHNKCIDCHTDYHNSQFVKNNVKPDCNSCHTAEGFTPSRYTIEMHNQGSFELSGSHLATPCFMCHVKDNHWEFRNIGNECVDCHKNIHNGYISEKYFPLQQCINCHTSEDWNVKQFDHNKTKFVLSGKHTVTKCSNCHFTQTKQDSKVQKFNGLSTQCESCHKDIHRGQFIRNNIVFCNECHNSDNWKPKLFNHDSADFKLEGAHINVSCEKCHFPATDNNGTYTIYKTKNKEIKCINCHS